MNKNTQEEIEKLESNINFWLHKIKEAHQLIDFDLAEFESLKDSTDDKSKMLSRMAIHSMDYWGSEIKTMNLKVVNLRKQLEGLK